MNKILVPTDFSNHADTALHTACNIASITGAELHVINVMLAPNNVKVFASEGNVQINAPAGNEYLNEAVAGLQFNMRSLINELKIDKSKVSYEIVSGNIAHTIIEKVEKEEVDLVVMGTQGESGYDAMLIGSNAVKIVTLAPCPVLTVRKTSNTIKFDKIVFATDLKITGIEHIMPKIREFKKAFASELHLAFINTPSHFEDTTGLMQKSKQFMKENDLEDAKFSIYCDYVEDDGIVSFANSIQADLIIVITHQRRGFARLLSGSVNESYIPVLTYGLRK